MGPLPSGKILSAANLLLLTSSSYPSLRQSTCPSATLYHGIQPSAGKLHSNSFGPHESTLMKSGSEKNKTREKWTIPVQFQEHNSMSLSVTRLSIKISFVSWGQTSARNIMTPDCFCIRFCFCACICKTEKVFPAIHLTTGGQRIFFCFQTEKLVLLP